MLVHPIFRPAHLMSTFRNIQREVKKHQQNLDKMLVKAEALALQSGDKRTIQFIQREKVKLLETISSLAAISDDLYPVFEKELKKRTKRLQTKIKTLNSSREALQSDNFLLEYKKKDLLQVTSKLEEAYEEITKKNLELLEQQKMIQAQTDQINLVHSELLAKNEELEMQKEALLDQSDYLHEANETISQMHREVENQKNEILKKNEELLTLNNEKNNLIGIVAHDLKSPLNQINGLLSLLKLTSSGLSPEAMGYIEMIEKSSGRLSDMIAKILDVEAIESKKMNLVFDRVDLGELISTLVERYEYAANQKGITVHTQKQAETIAYADWGYTEQVLENLLSNAIKFSPADRNVFIKVYLDNGQALCHIRDEGPGITEGDKKKLFGKYQKLSAKPTGNETSTGLGLSIVKKFVDAMNGRIWCESREGEGANFFVALPIPRQSVS